MRIFFLIFFLCSISWAKEFYTLKLDALTPEVTKELLTLYPNKNNQGYGRSEIDDILKWLHKKLNYDQVQAFLIEKNQIEFKIIPIQRVRQIQFTGLQAFSEKEISSSFNVKSEQALDTELIYESAEKLQKQYQDAGYMAAEVNVELSTKENNYTDILIQVSENKLTMIKNIKISSTHQKLAEKLEKELRSRTNKPFTDQQNSEIQKIIQDELRDEHYFKAEVVGPEIVFNESEDEVDLNFKIEKPFQFSLTFNGHKEYSISHLEETLDIDNYTTNNPNVAQELGSKLKNYYLSKGFARVDISAKEAPTKDPFAFQIIFEINEGPQVRIDDIQFSGRLSRDSKFYKEKLKDVATEIIQDGFYSKDELEKSLQNLKVEMQNEGYLLAKIISTRTQYTKNKDTINVFVNFDEGPLTVLSSITISGNRTLTAEELILATELQPNGPLRLNQLENAKQKLRSYYMERGYLEMTIANENEDLVVYDPTNTQATVQFKVYEGPRVEVASIVIDGNTFTKEKVIRLELEFKEGDLLTPARIEDSISRLQRTGYFIRADIKTLEEKTNVAQRTVVVSVQEREPGTFTAGVGLTNERGVTVRGFSGVSYSNILGTGRGVSVRIQGNKNLSDIKFLEAAKGNLGYVEPYLFNTRVRGKVYISAERAASALVDNQGFQTNRYTYSLEKDFTSHLTGVYQILDLRQTIKFPLDNTALKTQVNIASTGPSLILDYRDNFLYPTKGSISKLSFEYASPALGSGVVTDLGLSPTIKFYQAEGSFTHYYQIHPRWIFSNTFRAGYIENISERSDGAIPFDLDRGFFLGGQDTLRGFNAENGEHLPSLNDLGITQGGTDYQLRTNATKYLFKSELRIPIWNSFGTSIFYDGGYVYLKDQPLEDNYRDTAGISFFYNTPGGPLNIVIGHKLDRKEGEAKNALYLTFGVF